MVSRLETEPNTVSQPPDLIYDGLRVQLNPAPFWLRALALSVDFGLLYIATIALVGIIMVVVFGGALSWPYITDFLGLDGKVANPIILMLVLLVIMGGMMTITHGYFIYFEYKKCGQTPGKKLFALRVVTIDGTPLSLGKCMMRETLRYIDLMILPGLLSMLLTQKRQRLGDLLSGTMVSYSQHDSQEAQYLYVAQSQYLYLLEVLNPAPVPEPAMRDFLKFAYREFILSNSSDRHQTHHDKWEQMARQYIPQSLMTNLDQLTTLLFFAEYCQQTINRMTNRIQAS